MEEHKKKRSRSSQQTSFFTLKAIKQPPSLYTFILGLALLVTILIHYKTLSLEDYSVLFIVFLSSLVSVKMFSLEKKPSYCLPHLCYWIILLLLLFKGSTASFENRVITTATYSTLFLISYFFLMFSIISIFYDFARRARQYEKIYPLLASLLWAALQILLLRDCKYNIADPQFLFIASFLTAALLSALISFHRTLQKEYKKPYLIFFQSAFLSSPLLIPLTVIIGDNLILSKTLVFFSILGFYILTGISLITFTFYFLFISFWERPLVHKLNKRQRRRPLSIYPDPALYIDIHSNFKWIGEFIQNSDGGVIGITGLRGTGKSALLNNIVSRFKDSYFTLYLTSPIQTRERMEFLMMVCREVCSKIIEEIENRVFHIKKSLEEKGVGNITKNFRYILVVLIGMAAIAYYCMLKYPAFSLKCPLWFSKMLHSEKITDKSPSNTFTPAKTINLVKDDAIQSLKKEFPETPEDILLAVEIETMKELIVKIDNYLYNVDKEKGNHKFIIITPSSGGLSLYRTDREGTDRSEGINKMYEAFINPYNGLNKQELLYLPVDDNYTNYTIARENSSMNSSGRVWFQNGRINREKFKIIYYTQIIKPKVILIAKAFYFFSNNESSYLDSSPEIKEACIDLFLDFEKQAEKIFSRFPPNIDATQPGKHITSLAEGFGITNSLDNSHKLMSWRLLEAFFIPHNQKEKITLRSYTELLDLRDTLTLYLKTLREIKRHPKKEKEGTPPPSKPEYKLSSSITFPYLWVFIFLFLLFLFGQTLWSYLSFLVLAAVNYKAFGLFQESKEFLRLLSYSETRERGGKLSFSKLLTLSTKKFIRERDLSLPYITNRFIEYIKKASPFFNQKVIICIDELDKIDDLEVVKKMLREIKGALFVKNTFYFLSISEDAVYAFQNRLSSERDIFESTFDEFITLTRVKSKEGWEIIQKRLEHDDESTDISLRECLNKGELEEKMKQNAKAITLFAGGIPREIIRNLRDVLLHLQDFHDTTPLEICIILFQQKIQELMNDIGDMDLSGQKTVKVYKTLKEIEKISQTMGLKPKTLKLGENLIKKCFSIIEENKPQLPIKKSEEKKYREFDTNKKYAKKIVELEIMITILSFFSLKDQFPPDVEDKLFASYNMLSKNPSLARYLLEEIKINK